LKSIQPHGPQTKLGGGKPMQGRQLRTLLTDIHAALKPQGGSLSPEHQYNALFSSSCACLHGQTNLTTTSFFAEETTISILDGLARAPFQIATGFLIEALGQTMKWSQSAYLAKIPKVNLPQRPHVVMTPSVPPPP
jgi:hypothetical protein